MNDSQLLRRLFSKVEHLQSDVERNTVWMNRGIHSVIRGNIC